MGRLISLLKDRHGATAIEYALVASLISIVAIGAMAALGTNMTSMYDNVSTAIR
ncbi:MAG TPA: Flp family type IVb pilin [Sphingomicrobium sp.]|nr:Flp family type IVb pilin [Sphingomicrobium sp.]